MIPLFFNYAKCLAILAITATPAVADENFRTWKTKSGATTEGRLLHFDQDTGQVTILVPRTFSVDILSDDDQEFLKKISTEGEHERIRELVNQSLQESSRQLPPDKRELSEALASMQSVENETAFSYIKAMGAVDPNFDGSKRSPVGDIDVNAKETNLILLKYYFAEYVLAWLEEDKALEHFVDPGNSTDEVELLLRKRMLEAAIEAIEVANGKPLFAGLPYETKPTTKKALTNILKRLSSRYDFP